MTHRTSAGHTSTEHLWRHSRTGHVERLTGRCAHSRSMRWLKRTIPAAEKLERMESNRILRPRVPSRGVPTAPASNKASSTAYSTSLAGSRARSRSMRWLERTVPAAETPTPPLRSISSNARLAACSHCSLRPRDSCKIQRALVRAAVAEGWVPHVHR